MDDITQCITNLKEEIHTLQDENQTLYDNIKRMERNWDALIKQTTVMESCRSKLEREISKLRGELVTQTTLLKRVDEENTGLRSSIIASQEDSLKLHDKLQKKLDELHTLQGEAKTAADKYNHSMKVWKEEKRTMKKQREEIARKLDACEDELQAYFNENAKLEKQLKQVSIPKILLGFNIFFPFR
jgi:chromosome segregation ATPase